VLFDEAGYALTNHHVVAGAGVNGQGGLADGKLYPWKLVGTDPGGDVAIIKLERKTPLPASPLGRSDDVCVGDWAMAMGNPFILAEDQTPTVTLGIVSGVKRYQYGAGSNTLVYGNCIQVDSSINPGNSGGPLYNMRGEVIGINGRGSFKERGRVNVGVGYAISMRQIRNFIPDLMATKMAQHGTLDALFTNRRDIDGNEHVLCSTINLDAPVARLGLELGDKLIAFEGQPIDDANQFTNLISTLPAGWPVELTYEREGDQKTIWVRLTALPYGQQQIHPEEDEPPKEDDDEEKPDQPRQIRIGRAKPNFGQEGQIRDAKLNRENAQYILSRWREFSGADRLDKQIAGVAIDDDLLRKDKRIGTARTILSRDGRFKVTYSEYGVEQQFGFDGKHYWTHPADQPKRTIEAAELLNQPLAAQAAAIAEMLRERPLESLGEIQLDGSDKAQRRPCYRLRISNDETPQLFVWLKQFNDAGKTQIELAKTGADVDGAETCVLYSDWKNVDGFQVPYTRALATGLDESSVVKLQASNVALIKEFENDEFGRAADVE
jgi:S1-C subfamily serine protease